MLFKYSPTWWLEYISEDPYTCPIETKRVCRLMSPKVTVLYVKRFFFLLYMNGIYFLHLIFFPVVFSKQTLTHLPRNMYQFIRSIFGQIFNDLVSEMWASKLITEDTSGSVISENFGQVLWLLVLFFLIPCTYLYQNCRLDEKYIGVLGVLFPMQSITDMHDTFCSSQKCSSLQWGNIVLRDL